MTTIAEYDRTEAALGMLREKYADAVYAVETTSGMKDAKAARAHLRGYRTDLEAKRKEIKAPALQRCKDIDTEAKRIEGELRKLERPIDDQIKEEEQRREAIKREKEEAEAHAEAERKALGERQLAYIRSPLLRLIGKSSVEIFAQIKQTEAINCAQMVMVYDATQAKDETLAKLEDLYADAVKRESERARLAALEAEQRQRQREKFIEEQTAAIVPEPRQPSPDRLDQALTAMRSFIEEFGDVEDVQPVVDAIKRFFKEHNQ